MRDPANLPTLLQSFFTTRLMTQRKVSPHTIASYRDTFRLLLQFAQKRLHKAPSQLGLDDLDASLVGAFLEDLENRLSALGYTHVRQGVECWQVSRAGTATSNPRLHTAPQRRDPVLRFWLRRLDRFLAFHFGGDQRAEIFAISIFIFFRLEGAGEIFNQAHRQL